MKRIITPIILLLSILVSGCTHTFTPDGDIKSFHEKIEEFSTKRDAGIISLGDSLGSGVSEYSASSVRFDGDSLRFKDRTSKQERVISSRRIDRVVFSSGWDGAGEGVVIGVLIGGMTAFKTGQNGGDPDPWIVRFYPLAGFLGFIGCLIGLSLSKNVFLLYDTQDTPQVRASAIHQSRDPAG